MKYKKKLKLKPKINSLESKITIKKSGLKVENGNQLQEAIKLGPA